ncbi:uncharacterized mitochondrial protein-like protein [Tanacetum coccineum]
MDLESAQSITTAKLPILKQGEYDTWRLRIEQYFQVQDYALWDVIENGYSFKPIAQTTQNADGTSTSRIPSPVTTKEKYKDAQTFAPSTESFDYSFNRLQKIVTQLAILGENITQEDLNMKFLRSLPSEWNTHVVLWRNKPDLDTMSFDDLYNNFKIVKQKVKGTANSSSSSSSQNIVFVSSPSSTNELNTAYGVNTTNTQSSPASTQISIASTQVSTTNLNDLKEMDLKWQLALLSMRTRRWDTLLGNADEIGTKIPEIGIKTALEGLNVEDTSSKAMLAIDGAGFDWSYMADDQVPTNMALMDFSNSEVYNDKTCSKTCLKSFETLKTQLDDLRIEFNKSEFNVATYKRGLASVEEQLVFYKKNEVEKLKQDKESNQLKIDKYDNASKSLDKLIGSQITDNSRKEEFHKPEFKGYGPKSSKSDNADTTNKVRESSDALLVEELVSDDKSEKNTTFPTKIEFVKQQEKPVRKPVKYAEIYRLAAITIKGKWCQKVNTAKGKFYIAMPKAVNTARPNSAVVNAVRENQDNTVKTSAYWVWRPTKLDSDHPQKEEQGYFNSGCSRHMTGNMSYLSDFKEFDGGYVTFRGGVKGGKITGKGTLKTGKRDFKDVYFVKELQFNLFSISQMCNKKNSVLFTDTACFVLSHDFKLADKNKNRVMSEFCEKKGIKREYSVARTPQQNGVAERRNRTLIEAARTMLVDFKLPTTFWAEAVNTTCYVQNKFDGKLDDGFFIGYSLNSKAFRVYNIRTRKVEENLLIRFLEDKPIVAGDGPKWLFDIDVLTKSMNYVPVVVGTNYNDFIGTKESIGVGHSSKETRSSQDYIMMPLWKNGSLFDYSLKNASDAEPQPSSDYGKKDDEGVSKQSGLDDQERPENNTQDDNDAGPSINTASTNINTVLSTLNKRIHKDHSLDHVIGDVHSGVQTKRMTKTTNEQGFISVVYEGKTHEDLHTCLFACFLSQEETKSIVKALSDSYWVEAMQEELLQFKLQKVWVLVDLPKGYTQEEGIDYDDVFSPVARIEILTIPDKSTSGEQALYGLHSSSKTVIKLGQMDIIFGSTKKELCTEFEKLMHDKFKMSSMRELTFFLGLQVKQKEDGIFISQDKYVADILRKFSFTDVRTASTLIDTEKPLLKDSDVAMMWIVTSLHSMIDSLIFQVTPKVSHSHAVKRIFRYLKGQPRLGLWYPRDSPFDLVAYSVSDYAGARLDRKSTTRGCQFLGCRLISWQCKKQTGVATFSTEAKYVATTSCCGQRASKGYTGVDIPLFPTMLVQGPVVQGEGSIVPVESHHTPISAPSTSQPPLLPTPRETVRQETEVP